MTDAPWERALSELQQLHDAKQRDYGTDSDPWSNLRAGEPFGVPAWLHSHIMCQHKSHRIEAFVAKGRLENEGVRDSLVDHAVYSIASILLFDEAYETGTTNSLTSELERSVSRPVAHHLRDPE